MTEQEIQEFFKLPLNKRVDKFIEEEFVPKEQVVAFKYHLILNTIREQFPELYFMYFTDLLEIDSPEYKRCYDAYMNMMNGMFS